MFPAAKEPSPDRRRVSITRFGADAPTFEDADILAVEEPLEIRVGSAREHRAVSITMRTPGNDRELAAGFLFTEGLIPELSAIVAIRHCGRFPDNRNTVRVELDPVETIDLKRLERNFYVTSSCGVCGKSSLEALKAAGIGPLAADSFSVPARVIATLPEKLRAAQDVFEVTGGLHAAAEFDVQGSLVALKEDVGRHNAVDKLIGAAFLAERLPLSERILFLSGRASFELIQKAAAARVPVVCAVGAPSSLAVEAAREFGITLIGFVRDGRFNIYSGEQRINALPAVR
jgi:FdhD protein